MTPCCQQTFEFQAHFSRKVTADFSGAYLSSDGAGALIFRQLDKGYGLIEKMTDYLSDLRDPDRIEHSIGEMLRQRIGALAMGYEDLNDHDELRFDSAHALMAGKKDVEGLGRRNAQEKGMALASRSTLNRLELGALGSDGRFKKVLCNQQQMEAFLIDEGVKAIPRRSRLVSRRIVLDFYATDDPW